MKYIIAMQMIKKTIIIIGPKNIQGIGQLSVHHMAPSSPKSSRVSAVVCSI